jgi:Protein phosphatase inhibitor 2 (IPP-2)
VEHIRWDEDTIAEHDKLRGTRQKIDEPDTPYNFESQSDISDCDSADGSKGAASPGQTSSTDKGRVELEGVMRAVKVRLPTAEQLDKERSTRWEDDGDDTGSASEGGSGPEQVSSLKHTLIMGESIRTRCSS